MIELRAKAGRELGGVGPTADGSHPEPAEELVGAIPGQASGRHPRFQRAAGLGRGEVEQGGVGRRKRHQLAKIAPMGGAG